MITRDAEIRVRGCAFGESSSVCRQVARFEVFERLCAQPELLVPHADRHGALPWLDPRTGRRGQVPLAEVALRQLNATGRRLSDSTGLAFGLSFEQALDHAISELCERHLACLVWYRSLELSFLDRISIDGSDVTVERYTVRLTSPCPFVFAVARDRGANLWTVGTAVRCDLAMAADAAANEALMVYDSVSAGDNPTYGEARSNTRFASLRGPLALQRSRYLEQKCRGSVTVASKMPAQEPMDWIGELFGDHSVLRVVTLHSSSKGYVVRALCDGALTPTKERLTNCGDTAAVQLDPFV